MTWWQNLPSLMKPEIFEIGGFRVHWYSLMYIVAFAIVYALTTWRITADKISLTRQEIENYLGWGLLGVILGGRLGYVIFYDPGYYLENPHKVFFPFEIDNGFKFTGISGMSYHGGLLGVACATFLYTARKNLDFFSFIEFFIPSIPLGYFFGRIGNFINGELYGRITTAPWGMYFPTAPTRELRHPSQLYEAFFEGIFLFAIIWSLRNNKPFPGFLSGLYLIGYGTVRFFIEFFREPDSGLGFILGPLTMGQLLCSAMIFAGISIWIFVPRLRSQVKPSTGG